MKITQAAIQAAVAVGLLAGSVVCSPAFALMGCEDFIRNPDGSWTPTRPFVTDGPTGMVRIDPGNAINPRMGGVEGRLAANLTRHCPGVPRGRMVGPPPRPNPYLYPSPNPYLYRSNAAPARPGVPAIPSNGAVIENPPPASGGRNGPPAAFGTPVLIPSPLSNGGNEPTPSHETAIPNAPFPSEGQDRSSPSNATVDLNAPPASVGHGSRDTVILNAPSPPSRNGSTESNGLVILGPAPGDRK